MIRTCCQVHESGKTINTSMIHLEVMEGWHKRYFNKCLQEHHPKPHGLTHPLLLWKNTAFEDQNEYDTWLSSPAKLGKPTVAYPHGGMKQSYHDFADKIWEKFKVVKREIASSTRLAASLNLSHTWCIQSPHTLSHWKIQEIGAPALKECCHKGLWRLLDDIERSPSLSRSWTSFSHLISTKGMNEALILTDITLYPRIECLSTDTVDSMAMEECGDTRV